MIDKNLILDTADPAARLGFTQVPNFILRSTTLTAGAKLAYALFLSYAWGQESCFPGQERLAQDMGLNRSTVTSYVRELERNGYLTVQRRGLGMTNLYILRFKAGKPLSAADIERLVSAAEFQKNGLKF